jgi:NADPH-dependent 2,4-dienoyl-CoA reductase/sulfur reductase-like enzyme
MRTVVVGASLAGLGVVRGLRAGGYDGELTLIGDEPHAPYDRPPLSKSVLAGGSTAGLPLVPRSWYREHGVELVMATTVRNLDPVARSVGAEGGRSFGYDRLVVATGSRARRLPAALDSPAVHTVRTVADAERLRAQFAPGRRLLIVGAGFIGLEVAATARGAGLEVTVADAAPVPLLRAFGPEVGSWFATLHRRHGVDLRCGTRLTALQPHGRGHRATFDDGRTVDCDVVVAGVGAVPNIEWLSASGIAVDDGVMCDEAGRSSIPDVFAVGDVARWYSPRFDAHVRVEHWSNAVDHAAIVVQALLERHCAPPALPSFWSDQFQAKARFVGRPGSWDHVRIEEPAEGALVATFGWNGRLTGALCVNRPRDFAMLHRQIASGVRWPEPALR